MVLLFERRLGSDGAGVLDCVGARTRVLCCGAVVMRGDEAAGATQLQVKLRWEGDTRFIESPRRLMLKSYRSIASDVSKQ